MNEEIEKLKKDVEKLQNMNSEILDLFKKNLEFTKLMIQVFDDTFQKKCQRK